MKEDIKKKKEINLIQQLPHSLDAERATLGAALFSSESRDLILDTLIEDDFYEEKHKYIFKALAEFKNTKNTSIDAVVFEDHLRKMNLLEKCGGMDYIINLSSNAPVVSHALSYAEIVKENSLRRKGIKFAEDFASESIDVSKDIKNTISDGCNMLSDLSVYGTATDEFMRVSDIIIPISEEIEKQSQLGISPGIKMGFHDIDEKLSGIKKSQYVIIAARPSCGKTAFALSCMVNMLRSNIDQIVTINGERTKKSKPVRVGFFSLEMPREDIIKRIFSMISFVPHRKIAENKITEKEGEYATRLYNSIEAFYEQSKNFFIYDSNAMGITNIKAAARKLKKKEDVDIIFIDYFSRINTMNLGNGKMQSWEQWSVVSRELKSLAFELEIPIVCLVQLNRDAEKARPTLANLRDTGAIEQDADVVILLHDSERAGDAKNTDDTNKTATFIGRSRDCDVKINYYKNIDVVIAKNRNGAVGESKLCFLNEYIRFVDQDEVSFN